MPKEQRNGEWKQRNGGRAPAEQQLPFGSPSSGTNLVVATTKGCTVTTIGERGGTQQSDGNLGDQVACPKFGNR
ncbi:hypothetical protein BV898_19857 [Hypsibius exemplaris]|uniref:Uncharacterized protein n=1 Tax=Hypsibius exemplaris TaxID=2072580 RepID=A0A9X6NJP4_HYPEX|nr:hypothetical protein BV898_19857 [Hypsibius exemplaris]